MCTWYSLGPVAVAALRTRYADVAAERAVRAVRAVRGERGERDAPRATASRRDTRASPRYASCVESTMLAHESASASPSPSPSRLQAQTIIFIYETSTLHTRAEHRRCRDVTIDTRLGGDRLNRFAGRKDSGVDRPGIMHRTIGRRITVQCSVTIGSLYRNIGRVASGTTGSPWTLTGRPTTPSSNRRLGGNDRR